MQLDYSHSSSEEYVQLNFEDFTISEEESKQTPKKKSPKAISNHLQVDQIPKQALTSLSNSSTHGHPHSYVLAHKPPPPPLKLSSLSLPKPSDNDCTTPTSSPNPLLLSLKEEPTFPKRKKSKRLNLAKTNLEAQPSSYTPRPVSIVSPHSEPSSARVKSYRSFSISLQEHSAYFTSSKEAAGSDIKSFLKQSEELLDSFDILSQTINLWRAQELFFDPENALSEKKRIDEIFIKTFKSEFRKHWLVVVDKVDALLGEQALSPLISSHSNEELTRPRSVSLPMFGEYLHDPYSISLQESLKHDGISFSKQSAIRSAIHPLLSACLIDLSKPLTDKSNMKQMLKMLDLSKPDSTFIVLVKYRQSLMQLVAILNNPSPHISPHIPKAQQQVVAAFLGSLRHSKEVKLANGGKASLMAEYCQESTHLLYKAIESLDKAIQVHFAPFVESMQGQHSQLCHQTYEILLKRLDCHFEANLIRALEGKYLQLIKKKKKVVLTSTDLEEKGDQTSAIQKQNALLLKKNLKRLLKFLNRHLLQSVDKAIYQNWFTDSSSSSMPLTKESVMKEFASQYAALNQEWSDKLDPEMEPEGIDQLLNQFPKFKLGIVLGLFNQEFLKGITAKIIELHKHLTTNNSSCPIKSSLLEDHLSKKIRIGFKDQSLFFMAKRVGNLELDPNCSLTTIARFQAPINQLASLSISYELAIDLPDHPLAPEAAQQLEEILMIAQTMGLTIKMPSNGTLLS